MSPPEAFALYNKRYFGGRLPSIPVGWEQLPDARGLCRYEPLQIVLDENLKEYETVWHMTLLHEMVHLKQRDLCRIADHGHKFQREMKRLAALGAFNRMW